MCFDNLKKKWKCQNTLFGNPYYNTELADDSKNCGESLENNEWKSASSSLDENDFVEEATEFQ